MIFDQCGRCISCNHLEGDHEGPYDGVWYCDDDGCEDNLGNCTLD